jgi:hypothetical protein
MRSSHSAFNSRTRLTCIVLSYVFLLVSYAPFMRSGISTAVVSSKEATRTAGRTAVAASRANQSVACGAQRAGEVLVRFRPEVSDA